ncbi:hypothetical protein EBU71_22460, partial [bacterium]|nr:hypothetical protein [Candidatus Elulimicrobium humile]
CMDDYIEQSTANLIKLKKQRTIWMRISILFVLLLSLLVVEWKDLINSQNIYLYAAWAVIVIPICIMWWYWTMNLIYNLLQSRIKEIEILSHIVKEITEVKTDIKQLYKK